MNLPKKHKFKKPSLTTFNLIRTYALGLELEIFSSFHLFSMVVYVKVLFSSSIYHSAQGIQFMILHCFSLAICGIQLNKQCGAFAMMSPQPVKLFSNWMWDKIRIWSLQWRRERIAICLASNPHHQNLSPKFLCLFGSIWIITAAIQIQSPVRLLFLCQISRLIKKITWCAVITF